MAGHLVRRGFDVTVYDASADAMRAFVAAHGGQAAGSLLEAARGREAVITMLPDDAAVRSAVLGEAGCEGLASALVRGAVVIDMGTSSPAATRALAAALGPRGIDVVDAPVMGGVAFATDATLDIMVGGEPAVVERVKPLLQSMGRALIPCGPTGNAHAMKALANYVNACALASALEAMVIGRRLGLDAAAMAEALIPMCAGRNHPIEKKIIPHVLTRRYGTGMTMKLIAKDVGIALEAARAAGAHAPLVEQVAQLWADAAAGLGGERDQTEIVRYWEEATGVRL